MTNPRKQTEVYIEPGGFYLANENYRLRTLLGSCVSITLWHAQRRIGAMTHFLLPAREGPVDEFDGRYGEEATWWLLLELTRLNIVPTDCEARIFGGGNMFPGQPLSTGIKVGMRNGEAARRWLTALRFPIVEEDLYGAGHRTIVFDVATGEVKVQLVQPGSPQPARAPARRSQADAMPSSPVSTKVSSSE
jgi:chemotaxis protein CheD